MDAHAKIEAALRDIEPEERRLLEAFFAFANQQLAQANKNVAAINRTLRSLKRKLARLA